MAIFNSYVKLPEGIPVSRLGTFTSVVAILIAMKPSSIPKDDLPILSIQEARPLDDLVKPMIFHIRSSTANVDINSLGFSRVF